MKDVYKPTTTNCCGGFCRLEADILAIDLPGLNVTAGASVATAAGDSHSLKNLAEGFGFVFHPVQCTAGASYRLMAAAGSKTENGLKCVRADVVTSRLGHNNSPSQI